jgi:hypothetical protein
VRYLLNKKVGVFLFSLSPFLTWLFFAQYFSTEEDWWSFTYMEQISHDAFIERVIVIRVIIDAVISILIGCPLHSYKEKVGAAILLR